jgi:hypothetical protein
VVRVRAATGELSAGRCAVAAGLTKCFFLTPAGESAGRCGVADGRGRPTDLTRSHRMSLLLKQLSDYRVVGGLLACVVPRAHRPWHARTGTAHQTFVWVPAARDDDERGGRFA